MLDRLRSLAPGLIPERHQVPGYYLYGWLRGYHEPEMRLLPQLVERGDRVIDVGGNRGTYAYRFRSLGAHVSVFEPNPAYLTALEQWAADEPNVTIHPFALSSHSGEALLRIPIDASGVEHGSSASIEQVSAEGARTEPVALRTLDSFRFEDTRLIKIDVEGHEHAVIGGAGETLRISRPALLVEIEQRHLKRPISDIFHQVTSFGYRGFFLLNRRLQALETFDTDRHQSIESLGDRTRPYVNNFLFLHSHELERDRYRALAVRWM